MVRRLFPAVVAASLLVACGSEGNKSDNNSPTNNGASNNGATNGTATNNGGSATKRLDHEHHWRQQRRRVFDARLRVLLERRLP